MFDTATRHAAKETSELDSVRVITVETSSSLQKGNNSAAAAAEEKEPSTAATMVAAETISESR